MSNIELKITGMSCGACVSHVTKALQNVAGVRAASVDLGSQIARVEGEDLDGAALVAAVEEEGYGAVQSAPQEKAVTIPLAAVGCSCGNS
jgi:copper chaperone CopZ